VCGVCGVCGVCVGCVGCVGVWGCGGVGGVGGVCGGVGLLLTFDIPQTALVATLDTYFFFTSLNQLPMAGLKI
jgi:hypothetical protein